jgi:hypothetical protein
MGDIGHGGEFLSDEAATTCNVTQTAVQLWPSPFEAGFAGASG